MGVGDAMGFVTSCISGLYRGEGVTTGDAVQKSVAQKIRDDFDIRYRFGVKSTVERSDEARKLYWATQILFGLLLTVAIAIAVFALIASMATAAIERAIVCDGPFVIDARISPTLVSDAYSRLFLAEENRMPLLRPPRKG